MIEGIASKLSQNKPSAPRRTSASIKRHGATAIASGREITFALGKIKVEEKIYVTFELNRQ